MVPLILSLLLLAAQALALAVALRQKLWRSIPAWTVYAGLASLHILLGMVLALGRGRAYPMAILYFEPVLIAGQIAFTFESSLKYLRILIGGGSPEGRLLVWLIPLVPLAIVVPIEVGFIQEAMANWNSQEVESLTLLYGVRKFLSLTLVAVLVAVQVAAKFNFGIPSPAVVFHHTILTAYLACTALGYLVKSYLGNSGDMSVTITFFVIGPLICFGLWAFRMWKLGPGDLAAIPLRSEPDDGFPGNERRVVLRPL